MFLPKFYRQIIIRTVLIVATSLFIGFEFYVNKNWIYSTFGLSVLIFQTVSLIRFLNKTNDKLSNFIRHIRLSDTSVRFSEQSDNKSFSNLNKSFNFIIEQIKQIKLEKATQAELLKTIIEQVDIGLISCNSTGKIRFINQTAQEVLQLPPSLKNINSLDAFYSGLSEFLMKIRPHEPKVKTLSISDELIPISFKLSIVKLPKEEVRFYIFQNIKTELDDQELDSWQKLIRVLTHEIMNSITPITTLSHTIHMLLSNEGKQRHLNDLDEEMIGDALSCSEMIEERSKALINFVQQYRQLSQNFKLEIRTIPLSDFLQQNAQFVLTGLPYDIAFEVDVEPDNIFIEADQELIGQVLINLLKNAVSALDQQENAQIRLLGKQNEKGRKEIHIIDNGRGIAEEEIEKIFVPFYTTKSDGNGIGLSLSKQIMQQHGGTISVKSKVNQHTTFKLIF